MTTIDKAASVLRALGELAPQAPFSAVERATGIPKPTLYRIIRVLQERDMVQQDSSGSYRLGPKVLAHAASAFLGLALDEQVRQVMVDLGREAGLAVHVSAFRAGQLIYLDKLEADTPFYMRSEIGRRQAIHSSAIGKSVLQRLPRPVARQVLEAHPLESFTPYTVVAIDRIIAGLDEIGRRGYAIDDEEDELSTRAIGCAFQDADGTPVGGISIVAPTFETTMAELEALAPSLITASERVQELVRSGHHAAPAKESPGRNRF